MFHQRNDQMGGFLLSSLLLGCPLDTLNPKPKGKGTKQWNAYISALGDTEQGPEGCRAKLEGPVKDAKHISQRLEQALSPRQERGERRGEVLKASTHISVPNTLSNKRCGYKLQGLEDMKVCK